MAVRVLFIGDMHLKINRFDLALRFLTWLDNLIEKEKPDLVVNLGDTWDTHSVIRSEVACEFMKHVYKTLDQNIPYVYLLGNHDFYKPSDSKYHAMLPYKGKIPNLHIIDTPQDLFDMTFVPYQYYGSNFPKKTLPIVVAHQTFLGADYGPIRATEGVDATSIEGCDIIISGHIHTKSVLGPVIYVGSPFSQSAADVDQIKGITIFDTSTYAETFIRTPLPTWRRLHIVVSQSTNVEVIHALVEQDISNSKDHWVLELEGPKAEIVGYLGSKEYSEAVSGVDVKVKTKFTDNEKKKVSIEAKSMEHIISEYVAKVYNGSVNKDELTTQARIILNQARLGK
jgi:DNA repair exonuclease SbcCD nuclease subunit